MCIISSSSQKLSQNFNEKFPVRAISKSIEFMNKTFQFTLIFFLQKGRFCKIKGLFFLKKSNGKIFVSFVVAGSLR